MQMLIIPDSKMVYVYHMPAMVNTGRCVTELAIFLNNSNVLFPQNTVLSALPNQSYNLYGLELFDRFTLVDFSLEM